MATTASHAMSQLCPLIEVLKCLECGGELRVTELASSGGYPALGPDGWLRCDRCAERYPVIAGTPRMLSRAARAQLVNYYPGAALNLPRGAAATSIATTSDRTARSF